MQTTPPQASTQAVGMAVSAWMDGQTDAPLPPDVDADWQATWDSYHCVGQALRQQTVQAADPVWTHALMQRIAQEAPPQATPQTLPTPQPPTVRPVQAANDAQVPWRGWAVAASVVAALSLGWQWQTSARPDAVVVQAPAATATLADAAPVMLRDPALEAMLNAHRQVSGAAFEAPAGFLKAATFEPQR